MSSSSTAGAAAMKHPTPSNEKDDIGYSNSDRQKLLPKPSFKAVDANARRSQIPIDETSDEDDEVDEDGRILAIAFLLMLVFALGNRIFGRLQAFPMHNYPLFVTIMMTVVYIPVSLIYVIPTLMFTNNITKEQLQISKYKFAVMGAYDSIAGIMSTFAINFITNSSTIVLVQQSAIPISMVISSISLKSVYSKAQYIGAAIVLSGIVVVLIPTFFAHNVAQTAAQAAAHTAAQQAAGLDGTGTAAITSAVSATPTSDSATQLAWIFVLVLSCVPMCLSSVYKEKALGETEIDVMYLNGWVAVFQFLFQIPLSIPSARVVNLPADQILSNLYGGMLCSVGINTVTEEFDPRGDKLDDCALAPWFLYTFIAFNVVYNILLVVILKFGSANILFIASTVIVPLSNVAFSLNFMPGHQPLHSVDILGLVVIMTGLIIYRFSAQVLELWENISGKFLDEKALLDRKLRQKVARKVERKNAKLYGWNQLESLETFRDTRLLIEQRNALFRSPRQIRGSLLYKLGIPPSPLITMGTPGAGPHSSSSRAESFVESRSRSGSAAAPPQVASFHAMNYQQHANLSSNNLNYLAASPQIRNGGVGVAASGGERERGRERGGAGGSVNGRIPVRARSTSNGQDNIPRPGIENYGAVDNI